MSGGEYNYLFAMVDEMANKIVRVNYASNRRRLFADLLRVVAETMKIIEWVDSGDSSEGEANIAIDKALSYFDIGTHNLYKIEGYEMIKKAIEQIENDKHKQMQ